jgi:transposase
LRQPWGPARHALKRGADEWLQGRGADVARPAQGQGALADKGYDADWFRAALAKRGIAVCIPSKSNRKVAIPYDAFLYKQRHKIENMFGRLKDWRRIHTQYDRCAHTYLSAICIAAAVAFWLWSMSPEPSKILQVFGPKTGNPASFPVSFLRQGQHFRWSAGAVRRTVVLPLNASTSDWPEVRWPWRRKGASGNKGGWLIAGALRFTKLGISKKRPRRAERLSRQLGGGEKGWLPSPPGRDPFCGSPQIALRHP